MRPFLPGILACFTVCAQAPDLASQAALEAARAGDFPKVQFLFREMLADPAVDLAQVLGVLNAVSLQGQTTLAIQLAEQVLARFPRSALFRYQLGGYSLKAGRLEEAAAAYEAGLPFAEGMTVSAIEEGLGFVYLELGRREEAVAHYRRALEGRSAYTQAAILERIGEFDEAIVRYREAVRQSPAQLLAMARLANLLAERNEDLDEALILARRVATSWPQTPEFQEVLGWVQAQRGDLKDAEEGLVYVTTLKGGRLRAAASPAGGGAGGAQGLDAGAAGAE